MLTVSDNHIVLGGGGGGSTTFVGLSDKATADIPAINTPLATALDAKEATSNKKTDVDANKTSNTFFPSVKAVFDWVSGLFVKGAASSTDNAIALFDGATGKALKNCSATISAGGELSVYSTVTQSANVVLATLNRAYSTGSSIFRVGLSQGGDGRYIDFEYNSGSGAPFRFGSTYADANIVNNAILTSGGYGNMNFIVGRASSGVPEIAMTIKGGTSWGDVGIGVTSPTAKLDVNGTSRFRGNATFNAQIVDNVGSAGVDGQVLKKVGGLVIWANP